MATEFTNELNAELVIDGFKKLVALNQNNVDATLDQLKVSPTEKKQAREKLNGLLSGDETLIEELRKSLSSTEKEGVVLLTTTKGGITKYEILKQWGIPYGDRLYISHDIMSNAQDIGALITAITAACGPEAAPLVAILAITLAALKIIDRGNGIMITRVPPFVGPGIPTPQ